MKFDPIRASKNITDKYIRYLSTIFQIKDSDYNEQFLVALKNDIYARGPYLDISDPFKKGMSIEDYINNGKFPKSFSKLDLNNKRKLYIHQENAISRAINNKNIVVTTGTGSGKTESFLIPILYHIINEYELKKLTPGVRALLIYPLNALVNDQMEKLRKILSNFPEITYGSYTGQTKNSYKDALNEYRSLNENREPLENELISRDQMKEKPPHILITNYAMLEYLMLRPEDNVFFQGEYSGIGNILF